MSSLARRIQHKRERIFEKDHGYKKNSEAHLADAMDWADREMRSRSRG